MNQRALFVIVVVILFSLGMLGQYQISPSKLTDGLSTSIYEILMLFVVEGEWTLQLESVPLAIEIVRFTAPLVAIASIVLVIAENTRTALANFFVRFYRDHTVVVGLGEKSYQFLQSCDGMGKFVVVEADPENSLVEKVRELGINVIIGAAMDDTMLHRLNFDHASNVIVFTDSDAKNVEIVLKLLDTIGQHSQPVNSTRLHIHLDDFGLTQQLEGHPIFAADLSKTEIYFFSVYDISARMLLRDYPAELFADIAGQPRVHLAIHGFGRLAEKIIVEALLLFQFRNQSKLRLTLYDENTQRARQRLEANYPNIAQLCELEYRQQDSFLGQDFLQREQAIMTSVTQHIFCRDTDEENLAQALRLRNMLLQVASCNAPIFIRMHRSGGLAQLIHTVGGEAEIPDGIYAFGMLDQVMHANNILSPQLDSLAHAMHQMYVNEAIENNPTAPPPRPWELLSQSERKQNLLKADHWPVRLRAIRCTSDEQPAPVITHTPEESSLQAIMEHNRYLIQKRNDGWIYGEQRSNAAKTNPFMRPWEELPRSQRESELHDAESQPTYLADNMGVYIKRRVVLGVTGHRLNRMDIHDTALQEALRKALIALRQTHPHDHFTILSPLAEGADRLVAQLAMEHLGAELWVPLPLPYELYISDFTSTESIAEFQRMVGRAAYCFELPLKFGAAKTLAENPTKNPARNNQYALAGAYIAQRCDYLFAIYDGQGSKGTGGTADVLGWYERGEVDPDFEYPHEFFELPRHHPAQVFTPSAR